MDSQKKDPLYKSFGYAFEGIGTCIKKERNMKIHCAAAILVVIAGVILKISSLEWCICLTLFGLIMALELVNTAVEAVVDLVTEERKPLAKIAKDTAAGAAGHPSSSACPWRHVSAGRWRGVSGCISLSSRSRKESQTHSVPASSRCWRSGCGR